MVDYGGRLTGQLAAGVLRGLDESNYADLQLPVRELLKKREVPSYNTCRPSTLFGDLLTNLNKCVSVTACPMSCHF